jgi:hypothetical protein
VALWTHRGFGATPAAPWYYLNIKERIMTHFTTDEHGNRTLTHEGWTVRFGSDWIGVLSPCADHEVSVDADGLWVRGADGETAESFTIPWAVIEAIAVARAIRG